MAKKPFKKSKPNIKVQNKNSNKINKRKKGKPKKIKSKDIKNSLKVRLLLD